MLPQHPEERAAQANAPTSSLLPYDDAKLTPRPEACKPSGRGVRHL